MCLGAQCKVSCEHRRKKEALAGPVQPGSRLVTFTWSSSSFTPLAQGKSLAVGEGKGGAQKVGGFVSMGMGGRTKHLVLNRLARNFRAVGRFLFSCSGMRKRSAV